MLLDGVNHVAVITTDAATFHAFFWEVFEAPVSHELEMGPGGRLSMVDLGGGRELNVFELDEADDPSVEGSMFRRGRLDHLGLQAASLEAFEEVRARLMARGATDGFVTDFGPVLSVFFVGPEGLEAEVCVANPDARPGVTNPPGTPSARYPMP
jgi:catechol 2,3-dioxygenase-like lactoylglutathione lyase family enzyme